MKMKVNIGKYPKRGVERTIKIQIDKWDTYNAFHTIALIVSPLLKEFKKIGCSRPASLTVEEWEGIIDKIIWAMDMIIVDDFRYTKTNQDKIEEGCKLLGEWFQNLWN